jgi:hypothetical protein
MASASRTAAARHAQHRHELALRVFVDEARKARDANHRGVTVLALDTLDAGPDDDDGTAHPRVVGLEPCAACAAPQHAGHARVTPLDDALDASLDSTRGLVHDPDPHAIAVERAADGVGGNVHVVLAGGGDEPEAARVHRQHAVPFRATLRRRVRLETTVADAFHGAGQAQLIEQLEEAGIAPFVDTQPGADLACVKPAPGTGQALDDRGARGSLRRHARVIAQRSLHRAEKARTLGRRRDRARAP